VQTDTSSANGTETVNFLFNGRIKVRQPTHGYRFSIDSILLATFTCLKKRDRIVDLGSGVGIIPILLAVRNDGIEQIVGLELQEKLVAVAHQNVSMNGLDDLIKIYKGDIRSIDEVLLPAQFDVVVSNPPYYRISSGRINPSLQKAIARHELSCTLDDVLRSTLYLLKEGGRFFIIFPATRAITLLHQMRNFTMEPKRLRWVHSRLEEQAKFILVEAHKGGKEGVEVLPPFILYTRSGKYSPELEIEYSGSTISTIH
jgi:tRNA1Val (adenine37-N6)-methyltransferase